MRRIVEQIEDGLVGISAQGGGGGVNESRNEDGIAKFRCGADAGFGRFGDVGLNVFGIDIAPLSFFFLLMEKEESATLSFMPKQSLVDSDWDFDWDWEVVVVGRESKNAEFCDGAVGTNAETKCSEDEEEATAAAEISARAAAEVDDAGFIVFVLFRFGGG